MFDHIFDLIQRRPRFEPGNFLKLSVIYGIGDENVPSAVDIDHDGPILPPSSEADILPLG